MATFLTAGAVQSRKAAAEVAPAKAQLRSKVALSMYTDLPAGEIAIEEFERFAMDRLRGELPFCLAASQWVWYALYSGHLLGEAWPAVPRCKAGGAGGAPAPSACQHLPAHQLYPVICLCLLQCSRASTI